MEYDSNFWISLFLPIMLFMIGVLLIFFPVQSFYSATFILKYIAQRDSGKMSEDAMSLYQQDKTKFAQRYKQNIQRLRWSGISFLVMAVITWMILSWF